MRKVVIWWLFNEDLRARGREPEEKTTNLASGPIPRVDSLGYIHTFIIQKSQNFVLSPLENGM